MVSKAKFFLAIVSHGCQGFFVLGICRSWFPRLISAWKPSVMVAKANFCLATISHGCQAQFLLCKRHSWLPSQISAVTTTVRHGSQLSWMKINSTSQLPIMVAKTNSCLAKKYYPIWCISVLVSNFAEPPLLVTKIIDFNGDKNRIKIVQIKLKT